MSMELLLHGRTNHRMPFLAQKMLGSEWVGEKKGRKRSNQDGVAKKRHFAEGQRERAVGAISQKKKHRPSKRQSIDLGASGMRSKKRIYFGNGDLRARNIIFLLQKT